jgi:acetyltransferase-like isoleucine patch superfamily enzyme
MKTIRRIFKSISHRAARLLYPLLRPRTFGFKRNFQGEKLKYFSLGNTTFIDHRENLIIHNGVYIGHHNFIEASNGIELGEGVQITNFVSITSHSSHNSIRLYKQYYNSFNNLKGYERGSISIGAFTFVGPHSVIMPGAKIGNNCIVKAFSYVRGEFPDYSIIAGNPAVVCGDVRDYDKILLEKYPELKELHKKSLE